MSKIAKTALSDPISQPFLPPAGQIFFASGRVALLARPRRTNAVIQASKHPSIQASKHPSIQASKHPSISFHPEHPYARHGPMRASDPISLVPSYNRKPAQSHPRIPAGIRSPTQPTTTASQHAPPHPCWHPAFYAANSNRKSAACPSAPVYGLSIYVRMQRVRPSDRARPLRPAHIRANAPGRGRADGATTSQYTLEHPPSGGLAMGQTIQPAQVSPGEAMP